MSEKRTITAALAGDPNTGKSTFFNAWTGMHQVTGNWPGVTVEKLLGEIALPGGEKLVLVDLPGMYSLHAVSQDERVASDYARSGEADLIINVVDAVNLERNLYLTLALMELGKPMVVVLTMTDVLRRQGFEIDIPELSRRLGVPVVTGDVKRRASRVALERAVLEALATRQQTPRMEVPASLVHALHRVARENEPEVLAIHRLEGILPGAEDVIADVEKALGTTPDVLIADARYAKIAELTKDISRQIGHARTELGRALDRIALNRWLGIPLFLLMMYLLFWFTQVIGGCFIDFFDGLGDAFFVTGLGNVLTLCGLPAWLLLRHRPGQRAHPLRTARLARHAVGRRLGRGHPDGDDLHPAGLLHLPGPLVARGLRLHGPRGARDGSLYAFPGTAGQRLRADARGLRVHGAGHHGHAHVEQPP